MQNLRSSQDWADHLEDAGVEHWVPIFVDLINIFIAKSQFYSGWKVAFNRVQEYPQMKAWLNNESDCESDSGLWGETKNTDDYTFVDLMSWLKQKDAVKGKRPAVASSSAGQKAVASSSAGQKAVGSGKDKKKKKKEQKESSEEEESSSEEEKAKAKKSKGKKKASE